MHLQVKILSVAEQNKQLKWIQRNFMHDEILFYFVFTLWKILTKKIGEGRPGGWVCWSQGVKDPPCYCNFGYIYNIILTNV